MFKKTFIQTLAIKLFGGSAREFLLLGGSRSGKSFIIVFAVVMYALLCPGSRHLIARFRFNHVKNSIWMDTLPKVLKICFPGLEVHWNKSDYFIEFQNGSQIWIAGLDDKDRIEKILGMEFLTVFLNEASQISYKAYNIMKTRLAQKIIIKKKDKVTGEEYEVEARRRMFVDENPTNKKHWSYKIFFENIEPESKKKLPGENYAHLTMNPDMNLENIGSDYMDILAAMPDSQRKRFEKGEFSDESLDALWSSAMIDRNRVQECPPLKTIVVSIDPAVTSEEESDDTGIIVEGLGYDDELYILEDLTGKYAPEEWAQVAVDAFDKWEADMVIGEINNGGDLIESVLRFVRKNIPYESVRATRDKKTRAQPIASVYAKNKAHHVGDELNELEHEQTTWAGKKGEKSPNRIDALVWGAVYLMPIMNVQKRKPPRISQ